MRKETEEKLKVIKEMHSNGNSLEEMAKATGYHPKTVYSMMATHGIIETRTVWERKTDPEVVTYAKKRCRKPKKVQIRGKAYLDVTAMFID